MNTNHSMRMGAECLLGGVTSCVPVLVPVTHSQHAERCDKLGPCPDTEQNTPLPRWMRISDKVAQVSRNFGQSVASVVLVRPGVLPADTT